MTILEEKIPALEHKIWLNHPVTKKLVAFLATHETLIADRVASSAMDKETTPEHVRLLAAQLATVKTISKVINETSLFISKS